MASVLTKFFTQMPFSGRGHDAIYIVVGRLTKMVHLAATKC